MKNKNKSLFIFVQLLVLVSAVSLQQGTPETCPVPFERVGTECYYVEEELKGWDEARSICQVIGDQVGSFADLAVLSTCDQHAKVWHHILFNNYNVSKGFHLGGTDRGEEGAWYWLDGNSMALGVPFWRPGDPEGIMSQNCMGFFKDGYFIDRPCDTETRSICQLGVFGIKANGKLEVRDKSQEVVSMDEQ